MGLVSGVSSEKADYYRRELRASLEGGSYQADSGDQKAEFHLPAGCLLPRL